MKRRNLTSTWSARPQPGTILMGYPPILLPGSYPKGSQFQPWITRIDPNHGRIKVAISSGPMISNHVMPSRGRLTEYPLSALQTRGGVPAKEPVSCCSLPSNWPPNRTLPPHAHPVSSIEIPMAIARAACSVRHHTPPVSSTAFHGRPKFLRLISASAEAV